MKIVMVGAGNLATHFGRALLAGGNDVVQVYSRTDASASRLAGILGCEAVADVADIVTDADLYVVAVTDSVLERLLPSLCGGRSMPCLCIRRGACLCRCLLGTRVAMA